MFTSACLLLALAAAPVFGGESLSFSEGRAISAERDAVLLVLVHGSDWQPYSERVLEKIWKDSGFAQEVQPGIVLADVDILQDPHDKARSANDERNAGWAKKESGVRTYPAVLAYAPDGTLLGTRQGREFPRELPAARLALLELSACCREWRTLGEELAAARAAEDTARELELLVARDSLPLLRAANLLDELRRLDPQDEAGHYARLSFPPWHALVKQATGEAQAGKGAEAESRLRGLLGNAAYTAEQRCAIHLALGSAYRRWAGHEEQAAASFEAAWRAAPESVCGLAGMRLYLRTHGGPSLAFGWGDRHIAPEDWAWTIEDLPATLEPGTYRLRLRHTHGAALGVTGARLLVTGQPEIVDSRASALTKDDPLQEWEFVVPTRLAGVSLSVTIGRGEASRGTIEWARL